jgi:SAM-dependent methyltransferase
MKNKMSSFESAAPSTAPVPYTFERIHQEGGGAEVTRLEAQNLLLEKAGPLDQLPSLPSGARLLDVGSGTGFWSLRLAQRVAGSRITCLDRSRDLLALARQRLDSHAIEADFLCQDLRDLDLPARTFDLVFTSVTLAHVVELEHTLEALVTSLRPGGWIACFEPVQQSRRFCDFHPPCPNLGFLMDQLLQEVGDRGTDLSVGLKIAYHLERWGLEDTVLRSYGAALHGEDALACARDVFLPLARAYLAHLWEPDLLEQRLAAAAEEAERTALWVDLRRAVVLARKSPRSEDPEA